MADHSSIEWTDTTWNVVTGCTRVSPGCAHCYIERTMPFRVAGRRFDERGRIPLVFHPERLDQPLRWRKPRRVFVNSLADLFHEDVPDEFIARVLEVIDQVDYPRWPDHVFQVLTKRPARMRAVLSVLMARRQAYAAKFDRLPTSANRGDWNGATSDSPAAEAARRRAAAPPSNLWLGVSIENRRFVSRADELRATPAAVRFISAEPLLGPIADDLDLTGIDWVIAGGESGPGARPMHPAWVRELRDACVEAGVAFFFKQWGEWAPRSEHRDVRAVERLVDYLSPRAYPLEVRDPAMVQMARVGKKRAGRLLDGRTWDEMPGRLVVA